MTKITRRTTGPKISVTKTDAFEQYDNNYGLTREEYKLIVKTFNYMLMMALIETGNRFLLPNCGLI